MSGSGWSPPGWLTRNFDTLREFLESPKTFILGFVVTWVVKNVFIRPTQWGLSFLDTAGDKFTGSMDVVQSSLRTAFVGPVAALYGVPLNVHLTLTDALSNLGVAAPIATTVVLVVEVTAVVTIAYLLVRILLDVVPGGGAFL